MRYDPIGLIIATNSKTNKELNRIEYKKANEKKTRCTYPSVLTNDNNIPQKYVGNSSQANYFNMSIK